ncbi:MAG: Succinylornithine transaminase/acetylornithine aminotransferase [Verrucomicrobiota bacterium]|jgi:acetylornithine aminotransferase/acetylornithine/N-succinyldiaminopimelate aminotransferase
MGETLPTQELFERYVIPTYGRYPLRLARGEGSWIWDEAGKRYLDFGAGIAVTSLGHCHPRVVQALGAQLGSLVHTSNLYYTRPQGLLAQKLVEIAGAPGKVFFCNSGAEANEALYKLARKFGNEAVGFLSEKTGSGDYVSEGRHGIVTMLGSFHGRTLAGISATGQDKVKKGFEPMVQGFRHAPYNDIEALEEALEPADSVAVLIEPVQGESGIHPANPEFLRRARALTEKRSQLLLFDEVQCGLGRTGDWNGWSTLAADVKPDAVSWAKGIAGGFPLGAIWVSARPVRMKTGETKPLCDLLGPGSHGTTFGGTPLICAGALEVLQVIEDEGLVSRARELGAYALAALRAIESPWIREVRGVGLMLGVELIGDFAARHPLPSGKSPSNFLVETLHEAGLLSIPSGTHTLRFLPPLNVSRSEIDEAVAILARVLASLATA